MTSASFDEERAAVNEPDSALHEHTAGIAHARGRFDRMQQTTAVRRRLFTDLVAAQEQERRRIAAEIHDGGLQAMAVVLLRLGQLKALGAESREADVVAQLELSVRDAIAKMRQLIAGLVPSEFDGAGLAAAVDRLLREIRSGSGIQCRLDYRLQEEPRPDQRAVAFSVTQEALANARKHARPSRIDVLLQSLDGGMVARVTDDGVGFAVDATLQELPPAYLGLTTMRERIELVGGWLRIDSSTEGTTVSFWIPDTIADGAAA
jgi:signal transduction histidine kinase